MRWVPWDCGYFFQPREDSASLLLTKQGRSSIWTGRRKVRHLNPDIFGDMSCDVWQAYSEWIKNHFYYIDRSGYCVYRYIYIFINVACICMYVCIFICTWYMHTIHCKNIHLRFPTQVSHPRFWCKNPKGRTFLGLEFPPNVYQISTPYPSNFQWWTAMDAKKAWYWGFICWGRGQEAQPGAVRAYLGQATVVFYQQTACKWTPPMSDYRCGRQKSKRAVITHSQSFCETARSFASSWSFLPQP